MSDFFSKLKNDFSKKYEDYGSQYDKSVSSFGSKVDDTISSARVAIGLDKKKPAAPPIKAQSTKPARNMNYVVFISQPDSNRSVLAYLPESFNFDLNSEFSTPLAESLSKSATIETVSKLTGVSTVTQEMTAQYWAGGTHVSFNLPLVFVAESSKNEIMGPVGKLIEMSLPSKLAGAESTGFLQAPGARLKLKDGVTIIAASKDLATSTGGAVSEALTSLFDANVVGAANAFAEKMREYSKRNLELHNKISITIGKFLFFDNVVIKNVQQTFSSRFDADGYPMKVEVAVTIETMMVPTVEDMLQYFKGVKRSSGSNLETDQADRSTESQSITNARDAAERTAESEALGVSPPTTNFVETDPAVNKSLRSLIS
jgi:hypothetical protein